MKLRLLSTVAFIALGTVPIMTSPATAQDRTGMSLAENEALYVDAPSFSMIIGRSKGDIAAELKALGAHEIGPGAIIIRSGGKLYLAAAQDQTVHVYDPSLRNFAYDPAQDNAGAAGGGSAGYNATMRRNYAYDPAQDNAGAAGGGSAGYNATMRRNYAYDPHAPAAGFYDPEYAQYRLKKEFESHWTVAPKP